MREILFRGIDFLTGKWVQGDLLHISSGCIIYHGSQTESEIKENTGAAIELLINEISVVKPKTIGQFTGLTDKNGVKIFEGDFLNVEMFKIDIGYFNSVFFCESIQNYKCISTEYQGNQNFIEDDSKYCLGNYKKVVIGNIHDNPELLK